MSDVSLHSNKIVLERDFFCSHSCMEGGHCILLELTNADILVIPRCCFNDVIYTKNHFCCFSCTQQNLSLDLETFCYSQCCHVSNDPLFHI